MRKLMVSLAIGASLLSACSGGAETAQSGGDEAPNAPELGAPGEVLDQGARAEDATGGVGLGGSAVGSDVPSVGPTVIKTGQVELEVERDGFADAMSEVTAIAARHGGFVLSSTRAGEDARRGSIVIRVASDRFETAVTEIKQLGTVERETLSGEDVGQEFVDLEARLRNLEAQEAVYLRLFDEAQTITETIRIQNELSRVQLDIEQIEGRLRYLRDQTALGTITVSLREEGESAPGRFSGALERAVDGFLAILAGLLVFLGYAIPIAVLGLLIWFVWRRVARSLEKRGA